nr:YbhB/YbcL family Raf kinase inhibitor-like protein [Marinobacterium zhoushanense]
MTVRSADLQPGQMMAMAQVFNGFGCEGENISPELEWSGAPEGTKSFAIMAYDPDAPTGSGWWHWTVFNIPANVTRVETGASGEGMLPPGAIEGRTDFGVSGYGGACPPIGHGDHRYTFTVYALSEETLALDANAPAAMVGYFVRGKALDQASVEVTYGR